MPKRKSREYVSKRAVNDMVVFLKRNSINNRCTMSIQDIASRLGYANTTIHRILKLLQEEKIINIERPKIPTEPNTIIYNGIPMESNLRSHGNELCNNLNISGRNIIAYVDKLHNTIDDLNRELEYYKDFHSRIEQINDISDNLQQVIIKKDKLVTP